MKKTDDVKAKYLFEFRLDALPERERGNLRLYHITEDADVAAYSLPQAGSQYIEKARGRKGCLDEILKYSEQYPGFATRKARILPKKTLAAYLANQFMEEELGDYRGPAKERAYRARSIAAFYGLPLQVDGKPPTKREIVKAFQAKLMEQDHATLKGLYRKLKNKQQWQEGLLFEEGDTAADDLQPLLF